MSGASFAVEAPFASKVLRLRFQLLPNPDYIEAQGYVVGRREAKVVVSFTHIDEDARLALAQWVEGS